MEISEAAYVAGLFDGEGSVYIKRMDQMKHKRPGKPVHKVWVVRMEMAMTDKEVIKWCHELLGDNVVDLETERQIRQPDGY